MLLLTYSGEIFGELTLHSLTGQLWAIPFLAWLYVTNTAKASKWLTWGMITALLSYPNGESQPIALISVGS